MQDAAILERARDIRLLALDVDGVLTDGRLWYGPEGELLKVFNTLDGHGLKLLARCGIEVAVITGRNCPAMVRRVEALGIRHLWAGREDKLTALGELWHQTGLGPDVTAYMGDDWPDLAAVERCRLGATVPNAHPELLRAAHWCAGRRGGKGAVRELCDLILQAQGHYDRLLAEHREPVA